LGWSSDETSPGGKISNEKYVPKFPMTELWEILNSINNRVTSAHKVEKNCVETNSGVCVTTEARSSVGEEEEKSSLKTLSIRRTSSHKITDVCENKLQVSSLMPSTLVPNSTEIEVYDKPQKNHKYEKKNIYYKAIFRDVRRYFIEMLNDSPTKSNLKSKLESLVLKLDNSLNKEEVSELVGILAPFLNYNAYLIEFDQVNKSDANTIRDCLQNFTLTKMRKVLKFPAVKLLVKYYFTHTVQDGVSERLLKHKTMQTTTHKYLQVLTKILSIID